MNTNNMQNHSAGLGGSRISGAAAALWSSAFVIAALIIVQAGHRPGNQAFAAVTGERGPYSLLTASAGTGPDSTPNELLYVIDSREQVLLVYEIEDAHKKGITLRDGGSLDNLFVRARQ